MRRETAPSGLLSGRDDWSPAKDLLFFNFKCFPPVLVVLLVVGV